MISIEEACEKVIAIGDDPYVSAITDIGDGYVIGVMDENGEMPDTAPSYVNKKTGDIGAFFVPANFEKLEKGKKIQIPEKYKL